MYFDDSRTVVVYCAPKPKLNNVIVVVVLLFFSIITTTTTTTTTTITCWPTIGQSITLFAFFHFPPPLRLLLLHLSTLF